MGTMTPLLSALAAALLLLIAPFAFADDFGEGKARGALPEYLVVGAGGGGIQTALLLRDRGHTFRLLERASSAGSFWTKFPRFDELISVNKRVRNETQRLRYDWHSFLGTNVTMWDDVSRAYFPSGADFHEYMNLVLEEAGIEVEYNMEVASIATDGTPCVTLTDGEEVCARRRVFVGTGLEEKDSRYLQAMGGVPYSRVTREMAELKRVCVLGNGNAGFEVAKNFYDVSESVFVIGRQNIRLSAVTKYTGDVRVKFLQTLENFHGKLLDSVVGHDHELDFSTIGHELDPTQHKVLVDAVEAAFTVDVYKCELLVIATGFLSSVPGVELRGERFPPMTDWYAAESNPNVHYVGWAMHKFDFRRGAGGFLSGYRYLVRNLIDRVREADEGVPYPYRNLTYDEALNHAVARFQTSDELVILQDGVIVRDAIVVKKATTDDDGEGSGQTEYHYYEGVTYGFHDFFEGDDPVVYLYLGWGEDRDAASVFDNVYLYAGEPRPQLRNTKLHPFVEVEGGLVREGLEDIDMEWVLGRFASAIKTMVGDALNGDYSRFYPRKIIEYERAEFPKPKDRVDPDVGEQYDGTIVLTPLRKAITRSILVNGTDETLEEVREHAVETLQFLKFVEPRPGGGGEEKVVESCVPQPETVL
ncbi:hypothetical protein ACHAWF_005075 [Thalassiosira exigua]